MEPPVFVRRSPCPATCRVVHSNAQLVSKAQNVNTASATRPQCCKYGRPRHYHVLFCHNRQQRMYCPQKVKAKRKPASLMMSGKRVIPSKQRPLSTPLRAGHAELPRGLQSFKPTNFAHPVNCRLNNQFGLSNRLLGHIASCNLQLHMHCLKNADKCPACLTSSELLNRDREFLQSLANTVLCMCMCDAYIKPSRPMLKWSVQPAVGVASTV